MEELQMEYEEEGASVCVQRPTESATLSLFIEEVRQEFKDIKNALDSLDVRLTKLTEEVSALRGNKKEHEGTSVPSKLRHPVADDFVPSKLKRAVVDDSDDKDESGGNFQIVYHTGNIHDGNVVYDFQVKEGDGGEDYHEGKGLQNEGKEAEKEGGEGRDMVDTAMKTKEEPVEDEEEDGTKERDNGERNEEKDDDKDHNSLRGEGGQIGEDKEYDNSNDGGGNGSSWSKGDGVDSGRGTDEKGDEVGPKDKGEEEATNEGDVEHIHKGEVMQVIIVDS